MYSLNIRNREMPIFNTGVCTRQNKTTGQCIQPDNSNKDNQLSENGVVAFRI